MTPADLHAALEDRNWSTLCAGTNPWVAGARMLAEASAGLLEPRDALGGVVALGGVFARVATDAADPRRFTVPALSGGEVAAARPAVLFVAQAEQQDGPDLAAFALQGRRVWRWTLQASWLGDLRPDGQGVTRLWQDPQAWLRRLVKAAAAQERVWAVARAAGRLAWIEPLPPEARPAGGALVVAPAEIAWTRSGVLAFAEAVEIMDAPVDGPLGRALMKLNPRLGTARGIPLRGVEPVRTPAAVRRRAA